MLSLLGVAAKMGNHIPHGVSPQHKGLLQPWPFVAMIFFNSLFEQTTLANIVAIK